MIIKALYINVFPNPSALLWRDKVRVLMSSYLMMLVVTWMSGEMLPSDGEFY